MVFGFRIVKRSTLEERERTEPANLAQVRAGEVNASGVEVLKAVGTPHRTAESAAARLVAGYGPDETVDLDTLAATGLRGSSLAATAAAVDEYLNRHPTEGKRVHTELARIWKVTGKNPGEFVIRATAIREELISLATIDNTKQQSPAAAARLRADLSEYLTLVEGLTRTRV